jgi:maleylpyruvate isomerase
VKVYLNRTSNAPMRVRLALALKQLAVEEIDVDIESAGGEQHREPFSRLNPQQMIPVLVDGPHVITQSLAIIEYLDELCPHPRLLPDSASGRARVRSLAMIVACEGQPLVNLRVRQYLADELRLPDEERQRWLQHWLGRSLQEYDALLALDPMPRRHSYGNTLTLADVCLVPHAIMANRYGVDVEQFARVTSVLSAALGDERVRAVVGDAARGFNLS